MVRVRLLDDPLDHFAAISLVHLDLLGTGKTKTKKKIRTQMKIYFKIVK